MPFPSTPSRCQQCQETVFPYHVVQRDTPFEINSIPLRCFTLCSKCFKDYPSTRKRDLKHLVIVPCDGDLSISLHLETDGLCIYCDTEEAVIGKDVVREGGDIKFVPVRSRGISATCCESCWRKYGGEEIN